MAGLIRATHPWAYRSGQWALLTGTMIDPASGHACYVFRFPDGDADWLPIDDPLAGYEFG